MVAKMFIITHVQQYGENVYNKTLDSMDANKSSYYFKSYMYGKILNIMGINIKGITI